MTFQPVLYRTIIIRRCVITMILLILLSFSALKVNSQAYTQVSDNFWKTVDIAELVDRQDSPGIIEYGFREKKFSAVQKVSFFSNTDAYKRFFKKVSGVQVDLTKGAPEKISYNNKILSYGFATIDLSSLTADYKVFAISPDDGGGFTIINTKLGMNFFVSGNEGTTANIRFDGQGVLEFSGLDNGKGVKLSGSTKIKHADRIMRLVKGTGTFYNDKVALSANSIFNYADPVSSEIVKIETRAASLDVLFDKDASGAQKTVGIRNNRVASIGYGGDYRITNKIKEGKDYFTISIDKNSKNERPKIMVDGAGIQKLIALKKSNPKSEIFSLSAPHSKTYSIFPDGIYEIGTAHSIPLTKFNMLTDKELKQAMQIVDPKSDERTREMSTDALRKFRCGQYAGELSERLLVSKGAPRLIANAWDYRSNKAEYVTYRHDRDIWNPDVLKHGTIVNIKYFSSQPKYNAAAKKQQQGSHVGTIIRYIDPRTGKDMVYMSHNFGAIRVDPVDITSGTVTIGDKKFKILTVIDPLKGRR